MFSTALIRPVRLLDARSTSRIVPEPSRIGSSVATAPPRVPEKNSAPLTSVLDLGSTLALQSSSLSSSQDDVSRVSLELETSARLQHAARECARLQHVAKSTVHCADSQQHSSEHITKLQGIMEHLEEVEHEVVLNQLVLKSLHEHPEEVVCLHDPALEQQAEQVVRSRKAQGFEALLAKDAAAGVDSESLDETETQALMMNLELEIGYLSTQYTELSGQITTMQADPAYRFTTCDPLAACRWHRLLHAHTRLSDLEEAILVRQLLLRNLKANPDACCHSVHDPALEHEARTIMKKRKQLEKQMREAVSSVSRHDVATIPAALLTMVMVAMVAPF